MPIRVKRYEESKRLRTPKNEVMVEDNNGMRKYQLTFTVEGVKSQQTVSAQTMQQAEELVKKQYDGKTVSFTEKREVNESLITDTAENTLVSGLIIDAINDEFNTIQKYNGMILDLKAQGYEGFVSTIEDIIAEENTHIGQFEELLERISPNAVNIEDGKKEASKELDDDEDCEDCYESDDDFGDVSVFSMFM